MGKKKKGGGEDKSGGGGGKAARQGVPKGTSSGAVKNKERRRKTHEDQEKRKHAKLERRCADLCQKLHLPEDHLASHPVGKRHKLLRRMARNRGLVGEPIQPKKKDQKKEAAKKAAEVVNKEHDRIMKEAERGDSLEGRDES